MGTTAGGSVRDRIDAADQAVMARLSAESSPLLDRFLPALSRSADFARAREVSVRTMIFDVEPLVTPWHSSQESLDRGIARILGDIRTVPSVRVVVFATNSARRPSVVPACDGVEVRYLGSADRPLRVPPYHAFPGRAPWPAIRCLPTWCSPTGSGSRSCTT